MIPILPPPPPLQDHEGVVSTRHFSFIPNRIRGRGGGGDGIQKLLGFRKSIAVDLEESQKGREREQNLLCVDVIAHQSGGGT